MTDINSKWQELGYIDEPIPQGTNLIEEIAKLKKQKNAVLMAHYYQTGDIQDIADIIGDSLALAQKAVGIDADIILLAGVHFMGETVKILNPNKKVLDADLNAGCSLADSCNAAAFAKFASERQHIGRRQSPYRCCGNQYQCPPNCKLFPKGREDYFWT